MSWSDMHLATEAMAALVDNELSGGAASRARAHLDRCPECAGAVAAQSEAKIALLDAAGPLLSAGLLSRLAQIPFTAEMAPGMGDGAMALQGGALMFASAPPTPPLSSSAAAAAAAVGHVGAGTVRGAFRLR